MENGNGLVTEEMGHLSDAETDDELPEELNVDLVLYKFVAFVHLF